MNLQIMKKFNPLQLAISFKSKEKDPFDEWAKRYFTPARINAFVPRNPAIKSFRVTTGFEKISPAKFEIKLADWCHRNGYELNPDQFKNTAGRIIRKVPRENIKFTVAMEMIYIKVPFKK
jgi:hypothetical protein